MDHLHLFGIQVVQYFQHLYKDNAELMLFITRLGDPKAAFLVYFPLAYIVNPLIGIRVIWVAAIAEFFNSVFKWFLYGQRPYWWVHESKLYGESTPHLDQYRLTCETGPGSPSGHCMVTAATLYIIVSAVVSFLHTKSSQRRLCSLCMWTLFTVFMAAVSVSRCFIATHFPHQVVAGTLAGVILAMICDRLLPPQPSLRQHFIGALSVIILGAGLFSFLKGLGFDPLWSVSLALKYCANRAWIHLDTTLFFALIKDFTSLLGLGLALHFNQDTASLSLPVKIITMATALTWTQTSELVKLPQQSEAIYYILGAIRNTIVIYSVVLLRSMVGYYLGQGHPSDGKKK